MNQEKKRSPEKSSAADVRKIARKPSALGDLRRSEAKYRGFIENLAVMFYAAEPLPPYSPIYVSPAFEQFGYLLEEWRESLDLWTRVLHPDDRDWVLEKIEAAMRAGVETDCEYRMIARNGDVRWVRDRGSFVRDERGNVVCWQGIILDITGRKLGEQRLERSEKLYRTLAQSIPQTAVVLFDRDFRYTLADGSLLGKHGYSREMFEGKTLSEVFPPEISGEWSDYYRRALAGEIISLERESEAGCFQIYVVPVKNECGEIFAGMVRWQDITAEKAIENDLRRSEAQFKSAFEDAAVGMAISATNGRWIKVNQALCEMLGYRKEELINHRFAEFTHPDDVQMDFDSMKHLKSGELNVYQREKRYVHKKGHTVWAYLSVSMVRQADGEPSHFISEIQDITERKWAQDALEASSSLLNGLIEGTPDAVFVKNLDGHYLMMNSAGAEFFGKTPEDFIGRGDAEIYPAETAKQFVEADRQVTEGGKTQTFEGIAPAADGSLHTHLVTKAAYRNQQGEIVGLIGISHDITERKRAEEALRESEERYRTLVENASDLIYVRDVAGNYLSINKATERVLGYTREEALKINVGQIVAPEHLGRARQMLADELAGVPQTAYEIDCLTKHGNRVTLEVNSGAIYKNGAPVAVQGIARDVTERRRTEQALREREEQYRDLFENANDLIYTHDLAGNFTSLNRAGEMIVGYTREECVGMNVAEIVAPDHLELARSMTARKVGGAAPTAYELEIINKNGDRVSLELSTRLIVQDGVPTGVQGIGRDITARKLAEESLLSSERRYRALGEGIMHQVWTAQPDGKLDYVNGRAVRYFGLSFEQLIADGWQTGVHPDDLPDCLRRWRYSLETGRDYEMEFRLRRQDGEFRWHKTRATAALDADGKVGGWFGTNSDINDQKLAEAKLSHNALHDALTNLPNRAKFMNHLERAVSRAECNPAFRFAVLFLDLDRFKVINDSLGHTTGDKLLVAIAERLELCVRPGDIVARLGGDEFTVLLNNINDCADAVRVANRFLEKLSAPFKLDAYEVFSSASIGIIVSDEVRRQPEDFLRDADTAMYRAKEAGKSRYEIFDREMHIRNMKLLQLENDLRRAIEQNEFAVFYQPIVCLETGEIREFEALIRWRHPQYGLVPPNDFIGIAEETGLIIPIGRWVLEEACRQTAGWRKCFPRHDLSISVNLSAKQLMHPNLNAQIREILTRTALDPRCLKLEVTESMVMENSHRALSVISDLHALGISVSTDDFGTGYSSLSYLHRFPFDCLKIDRSFVSKMDVEVKSAAIVRTVLLLAQNLNIEVVAEGIETERQLINLRQLGCQTGQGYLFSKPVDAESAARLLRDGLPFVVPPGETSFAFNESKNEKYIEVEKIQ